MPSECPTCRKTLSGPAASAAFCMYCGVKLPQTELPTQTHIGMVAGYSQGPRSSDIDQDDITADIETKAYGAVATEEEGDSNAREPAPEVVGGFRIMNFLGAGGQGDVYEAEETSTGQRVAVKLLSAKFTSSATSVERFKQEGRLASQISHPRCVFVYGADTDHGRPYIVMELMPGQTLKDHVERRGPLPVTEAIARILDVIDGLAEAHRLGVIHRDVKPSNCFLTADERIKVGDFGLSKSLGGSNPAKHLTGSGRFVGTVLFAPPEQIRGEEVGYDSDVYAVCATLYFLLTGQAPHQHESVTAALAKVISEPPPPIRAKRQDCPRELEKIVLRGLERDRTRRWQSLLELREALASLLPSRQLPARPRALSVAFLVDSTLIQLAAVPLEIIREWIFGRTNSDDFAIVISWITLALTFIYFTLCEGLLGTTLGKWLVRLKVVRLGQTGPPGLRRAFIRTLVFNIIWYVVFFLPGLLVSSFTKLGAAGQFFGIVLAIGCVVTGLVILLNQCRQKWAYRGLHDFASGCRAITSVRPPQHAILISPFPNPLEQFRVAPKPLPESVGGFAVKGLVVALPGDGMIWAAEDRSLGRRVLLELQPQGTELRPESPIRPTRCRQLGTGELTWADKEYHWVATVSPAGAPLTDLVSASLPLAWADTRPIIEQLTDELIAADKDNTTPTRLGVDQVWVEPGGRVQLTDYPLPTGTGLGATDEFNGIGLIRQAAVFMLEGKTWAGADRIAAPIPPHASRITNRLVSPANPYGNLNELQHDLAESHIHPARLGSTQRLTHLGVQALFMATGMILCVGFATLNSLFHSMGYEQVTKNVRHTAELASQSEMRTKLLAKPGFVATLAPRTYDETLDRIEILTQATQQRSDRLRQNLTRLEIFILDKYLNQDLIKLDGSEEEKATDLFLQVTAHDTDEQALNRMLQEEEMIHRTMVDSFLISIAFFFVGWLIFAAIFRGGVSWFLGSITIVRSDGRPASRILVTLRSFIVWLPIFLLLTGLTVLQLYAPSALTLRVTLTLAIPIIFLVYIVVGIRFPDRPPQDRILGTFLVPV